MVNGIRLRIMRRMVVLFLLNGLSVCMVAVAMKNYERKSEAIKRTKHFDRKKRGYLRFLQTHLNHS